MKRWHRVSIAMLSFALSLPAFGSIFVGFAFVVMLSGFQGSLTEAILRLASSGTWESALIVSALLLLVCHVLVFCYLLILFARARALPVILQTYCFFVVMGVIIERIRLVSIGDEHGANFWFGLLSLPHALALMVLFLVNNRFSKQSVGAAK